MVWNVLLGSLTQAALVATSYLLDHLSVVVIFQWNFIKEYLNCVLTLCSRWEGEGCSEIGKDASNGKVLVAVDPKFYRPTEVVSYCVHGWERTSSVEVLLILSFLAALSWIGHSFSLITRLPRGAPRTCIVFVVAANGSKRRALIICQNPDVQ